MSQTNNINVSHGSMRMLQLHNIKINE